jgi:hypothetical protein
MFTYGYLEDSLDERKLFVVYVFSEADRFLNVGIGLLFLFVGNSHHFMWDIILDPKVLLDIIIRNLKQ